MLNITKFREAKSLKITLEGRFDTGTAPQLEEIVRTELADVETLIFDFAKLEYISSAGLRVLLAAQKIMNKQGRMVVKNVSDEVKEIFEVTGFTDILTLE
ncbi:MAG: STAS domain-containing protein [Clostridiales bacterium]|nr:STAS domain-containing protein [Clostridiales bacterium]